MIRSLVARRWLCGFVLLAFVFAQMATASHACPPAAAVAPGAGTTAVMPCAESMPDATVSRPDADPPGLCLEHCKGGTRAVDSGHAPILGAPIAPAAFVVADAGRERFAEAQAWRAHQRARDRARPPPASLLFCCLRD